MIEEPSAIGRARPWSGSRDAASRIPPGGTPVRLGKEGRFLVYPPTARRTDEQAKKKGFHACRDLEMVGYDFDGVSFLDERPRSKCVGGTKGEAVTKGRSQGRGVAGLRLPHRCQTAPRSSTVSATGRHNGA